MPQVLHNPRARTPGRPITASNPKASCVFSKSAGSKPLWRLAAHEAPACSLSFCPAAPGLMATASTDKKVSFAYRVTLQLAGVTSPTEHLTCYMYVGHVSFTHLSIPCQVHWRSAPTLCSTNNVCVDVVCDHCRRLRCTGEIVGCVIR